MTREIVVDSFAGGGGASTGIELALTAMGVDVPVVDVAINHSGSALAMHAANHPDTVHLTSDIWHADPLDVTQRRAVGLLWASPDCRHFSRAKGAVPVSRKLRGLAWSVAHWAEQVRPRVIMLENVMEFCHWGPLIIDRHGEEVPDPHRKGETFRQWVDRFRGLGYMVDWRVLRAADYGAPTARERLFIIMRCDDEPIVWPKPTHGAPGSRAVRHHELEAWKTAAEIVDWARPMASVLLTAHETRVFQAVTGIAAKRPLADNTFARIARGVQRFVLERPRPFMLPCPIALDGTNETCRGASGPGARTARVMAPFMVAHYSNDVGSPADAPVRTVTGIPKIEPVVCWLAPFPLEGK